MQRFNNIAWTTLHRGSEIMMFLNIYVTHNLLLKIEEMLLK
jgi:hypothetical protein